MKVLIIGNGVAGLTTAKELRQREGDPEKLAIEILGSESYPYYSRIRLPELLASPASLDASLITPFKPSWYGERAIVQRLGIQVIGLRLKEKKIILASGEELPYDALVLALGAEYARPRIPGADLPGVQGLRELDDALRLRVSLAGRAGPVAVLGGGALGLELASWLARDGSRRVEVLEYAAHLLPRQLDAEGGAVLQGLLAEKGVFVRTGARIAALEGDLGVESVVLEDGERIAASIVIPAMGAKPRLGLAMAAGLETGRGIIVDRFMRTRDPSVYAVGDCAEFEGQVSGFVAAALDQAATAAASILGDDSRPWGAGLYQQSLKVSGIELFSEGRAAEPPQGAQVIRRSSDKSYACLVLFEGRLVGAAMIGSKEAWRRIQPLVGKAAGRADIEGLLGPPS